MDSEPEVEVIDLIEGAEYSFDELHEIEVIAGDSQVIAGKGKLVNHMDAVEYMDTDRREFAAVLVNAEGADGVDHADANAAERHELLTVANGNGEAMARDTEDERNGGNIHPSQRGFCARSIAELNEPVCRWVKLWMVIVLVFVAIFIVIIVTVAACSAIHVDEDEQYDRSLFNIPHYFNGSFQIHPAAVNESHIPANLQLKLANLYRSSHALGRYFSEAEIHALRDNPADIVYKLTFVLPEENQEELRNFTLSREMVQNVFRQFLAEQDDVKQGGMYIYPLSLRMSSVYVTDVQKRK